MDSPVDHVESQRVAHVAFLRLIHVSSTLKNVQKLRSQTGSQKVGDDQDDEREPQIEISEIFGSKYVGSV